MFIIIVCVYDSLILPADDFTAIVLVLSLILDNQISLRNAPSRSVQEENQNDLCWSDHWTKTKIKLLLQNSQLLIHKWTR